MCVTRPDCRQRSDAPKNLQRWLKYISVTMISLVAFEAVAVATAMPYVVEDLGGENFYALASGIVLATQLITTALAGPWCDAKGPKPVLYTGSVLFLCGLSFAAFAPDIGILVLGRATQGLGAGMLIVPLYVMIGRHVEPVRQPAFFAAFAAAWVFPSLVGPAIAGIFVDYLHWRWVFGVTPILLLAAAPFMLTKLRRFPDARERKELPGLPKMILAAAVSGIAACLLQMLSGMDAKQLNLSVLAAIVFFTCLSLGAIRPLLPPRTLTAAPGVPATVFYRGIINGTYLAVELYLPLMLKNVHGFSPTRAGLVLTVGSVTWAIGSWIQGRLPEGKIRRALPLIGSSAQIVGSALTLPGVIPNVPGEITFIGWLIASFGIGLVYPAMTVHALALTALHEHGKTSSGLQISDTLGAAVMIAYAGIVYAFAAPMGNSAFAVTIGFVCAVMAAGLLTARRIRPRS